MEQISLTGATLLSDHPGRKSSSGIELTSNSSSARSSSSAAASSSSHGHDHDHSHGGGSGGDEEHTCPHHPRRAPVLLVTHPQIQALPANIPALAHDGTNAELFEALCTFIRLSRHLEERNDWYSMLLQELQHQQRLWAVMITTSPDEAGHTLLHWAAKRSDDPRFLQLLLQYAAAAPTSALSTLSSSPTSSSLLQQKPQPLPPQSLAELVNLASVDSVGMTPLHWACTENCQKHVQYLLQYGASLESVDNSGCTPLLIAAQYGHVDLVAILIRRGANGLAVDKSLDTALHWAAYKGSMPVCGVLTFLVPQLSYTTPDAFGQTPLHLAALRGHTSVVRYILANLQGTSSSSSSDQHHHLEDELDEDGNDTTALISSSPRRRQRQRQYLKAKEDLLWMRDSQGRTPMELALSKQRPTVAALLQHEMDQLQLHHVYHSPNTPYARKVYVWLQHNLKLMCSIHNWKVWMGCRTNTQHNNHYLDEVDESPKFPFYIVLLIFVMHVFFYPMVFTPIGAVDQGLLWDLMGWHLLNWLSMLCLWYCFYKIATVSPGYVGGGSISSTSNKNNSNNNNNIHHSSRLHRGSTTGRPHVDSLHSSSSNSHNNSSNSHSQVALTQKWRRRYEQVLDSYALDSDDVDKAEQAKIQKLRELPLCHTCHIARPLRSKHCRVARRCVLMFDHHCPFVGNTIGLYNYMWFYLTLIMMTLCEVGFMITWAIYIYRYTQQRPQHGMPWKVVWMGLLVSIWILPAGGMALYHTQLTMVNMTTNEHQNLPRYKYLHDPVTGRYRNPWFHGWFYNAVQRFAPNEACYTLPEDDDHDDDDHHNHHHAIVEQV